MSSKKSFLRTWKAVPLLFIVHVALQAAVLTFIGSHLPKYVTIT